MRRYEHGGAGTGLLDFSVNLNPLGMPDGVRRAVAEHAAAGVMTYAVYPDPACGELRQAIAARRGVAAEQVLCGNGAADLIWRMFAALRPGKTLLLAPTFSEYERSAVLHGGEVAYHYLREDEGFAVTQRLLADIAPDVRLVFLCNPNNPTGRLMDGDLLREVARRCAQVGAVLAVDECFLAFARGESAVKLLGEYPNLLVLDAFTKLYAMAGLRLGYALGDAALLERIGAMASCWSVSAPAQIAGLAALDERGWAERTREAVAAGRAQLAEGLAALGITVFPGEANFILLKSEQELYAPLKERGIAIRRCGNFEGLDERFYRVGAKLREDNARLLGALGEVLHG